MLSFFFNKQKDSLNISFNSKITESNDLLNNNVKIDSFKHIGHVISIGDGVATIFGLEKIKSGEMVLFLESNIYGMALNLNQNSVGVVIFGSEKFIKAGHIVSRCFNLISIPVSEFLLGRVIDVLGNPIDNKKLIDKNLISKIEIKAPGILERYSVNESLVTGVKIIDALIPIGRGQRELIIGDRQTGKTSLAIDAILNQKNSNYYGFNEFNPVYCIYVSIGQKRSTLSQIVRLLTENNAINYTVIVAATASEAAPLQFLAPYAGCTIGEFFRDRGLHALIIYDDLSKQAIAYRQMSLLLKRPSGREAYPGDVFYLHSRLLERAAKLSYNCGYGSLTALPIVETQAGDVSAYIPTNVISITDGQIFLETQSFLKGIIPAVNVGLSVSRVGSASQIAIINKLAGPLKLELAQYRDLLGLTSLDGDIDPDILRILKKGEKIVQIFIQPRFEPLPLEKQILTLFAVLNGYYDHLNLNNIKSFEKFVFQFLDDSIFFQMLFSDIIENRKKSLDEI
jgi:proton translocating ATP synthase F1 alpha subunit